MTRTTIPSALCALLLAVAQMHAADAFVIDDSFEANPTPGNEAGWNPTVFANPRASPYWVHNLPGYRWDSTVAHSGTHAIRLAGMPGHNFLSPKLIPVAPGDLIEVSAWVKTETATGATCPVIRFVDTQELNRTTLAELQGGTPYGGAMWQMLPLSGTRDWTQVLVRGRAPAGTTAAQIHLQTLDNTGGVAWYDDLRVRHIPAAEAQGELQRRPPARPRMLPADYVSVSDGHLSQHGQRLRIWSAQGNLQAPTHADIDREVARYLDHGFNGFRTLWWDKAFNDAYAAGDGSEQDLRDYLLAALAAKGCHIWCDLLNSCHVSADQEHAIEDPATAAAWHQAMIELVGLGQTKSIRECLPAVFDPRIRAVYHAYIAKVMAHQNKHNGLAYGEDPAFFCWELTNEEWWFMRILWGAHLSLPKFFQEQINVAWNEWLLRKYGNDAAITAAWGSVLSGETVATRSILLLPLLGSTSADGIAKILGLGVTTTQAQYGPSDFSPARGRDVVQFLTDSVRRAKAESLAVVRAQGRPGVGCQIVPVIYDTAFSGSPLSGLVTGDGSATTHATYQDMSSHDPAEASFPFRSLLRKPPLINNWIDARTVVGKPAFMYEVMTFNPQKYRLEFIYELLANAAIQDLDVVSFHYYGHPLPNVWADGRWDGRPLEYMNAGRNWDGVMMRTDEVLMSAVKVCAEAFTHGYLQAAAKPTVLTLGSASLYDLAKVDGGGAVGEAAARTAYHHGFRWRFDPSVKDDHLDGELIDQARAESEPVHRPTPQISYHWKQDGLLVIDAAHMKALVGFAGDHFDFTDDVRLSGIQVTTPKDLPFAIAGERYVGISLVSRDGKPLAASRSILLSAMSTSANAGLLIDLKRMAEDKDYCMGLARSVTDPGHGPVLVARVAATIEAEWLAGRRYRIRDFNGTIIANGTIEGCTFTVPPDQPAYLIEISQP
jgi:hypothetical protein